MNSNICIKDASFSNEKEYIIIQREKCLLSISNSNNNGFKSIKTIILHSNIIHGTNSEKYLSENKNLTDNSIIIPTDVDIDLYAIETSGYVTAIVSSLNSDFYGAGEKINELKKSDAGEIHIILLINRDLTYKSLMNAYSKALEAKIAALWDLDVRSDSWDLAVGNIHDSMTAVCTGKSNEEIDENELQYLVGKCVRNAVAKSMLKSGFSKGVVDFIEGIGIKIDDLVEAGMELVVGVEETEELHQKLHKQILKSLEDLNVVSFIIAGIRLEEDYMKHRVKGVNVDDDPAYLYSDEVFGMSIANQIAGTKAIFNFKRYDEEKPRIISTLGPVLDDVFAGLIAGCMSKIFEE